MRAREIITALNSPSSPFKATSEQRKQDAFVHWHALREDWIKLNIDGASNGNPRPSGGAGIFRDHYENYIKAFACNFSWRTPVMAEVLALFKGLRIAWDMGYKKLEINLDSQITVKKTEQLCKMNQPLYFIMRECKELMARRDWEVKLRHCYREANRVADYFANLGVNQTVLLVIFDSHSPPTVMPFLRDDVFGVSWPRCLRIE